MKLISYNLNGLRAAQQKGFANWLAAVNPDIIGIQEMKANEEQLYLELYAHLGYSCYTFSAEKKGYSGVAVFTKQKANQVFYGLGNSKFDVEGRVLTLYYDHFILINLYAPAASNPTRLDYKLDFFKALFEHLTQHLQSGLPLIIMGDFNICHHEIDLWTPDYTALFSGFLREERLILDHLIELNFVDAFRELNQTPHQYTWWSPQQDARRRNLGYRIDYIFISSTLANQLVDARHLPMAKHSDHCPVVCQLASLG